MSGFDGTAADRARALLTFCDGVEDSGHPELARRCRVVARDVLRLVGEVAGERACRQSLQTERDRCLEILAGHAASMGATS